MTSESPALDILDLLNRQSAAAYTDRHVTQLQHGGRSYESVDWESALNRNCDCVVVTTAHSAFDYERIAGLPLVVDARNAVKRWAPHIFPL